MSNVVEQRRPVLIADYLRREIAAETKSEFEDGDIIGMAGATVDHSRVQMNAARAIGNALSGKPCQVHGSDLRLRIPNRPRYRYPDLMMICGKPQLDADDTSGMSVTNPRVVIEILSPTHEVRDRGIKFDDYRSIESLEEYILISQSHARIESFKRQPDGDWKIQALQGIDAIFNMESLGISLPLRDVYAGVELPPADPYGANG
jgi:Uma2 family endonuclease